MGSLLPSWTADCCDWCPITNAIGNGHVKCKNWKRIQEALEKKILPDVKHILYSEVLLYHANPLFTLSLLHLICIFVKIIPHFCG